MLVSHFQALWILDPVLQWASGPAKNWDGVGALGVEVLDYRYTKTQVALTVVFEGPEDVWYICHYCSLFSHSIDLHWLKSHMVQYC